jgi:dihydropteroate synthase
MRGAFTDGEWARLAPVLAEFRKKSQIPIFRLTSISPKVAKKSLARRS